MTQKLTYTSLPVEIKKIANNSLGLGVLKSLFSYAHTYHLILKIHKGVFIGFALYHFRESSTPDGGKFVTGVIDAICVDLPYRKEGFGTLLTLGALRKMSAYGVDRVEMTLKAPRLDDIDGEPGVPIIGNESFLKTLGFRKVKAYKDHYRQKSMKYGYDCILCDNRPDRCTGLLYAIDNTGG